MPALDTRTPPWPGEYTRAGQFELYVRRTPGPGGPAPAAVYVHGLGGSATNWTDLAALLSDRVAGYAVDLPGFGRTRLAGARISPQTQAEAVMALVESLADGPVELFGNSMGGLVTLLVAAQRPELVRTLTLISPAVPDFRPSPRRMADPRIPLTFLPVLGRPARRKLAALSPEQRARQVVRLCFAEPEAMPENRMREAIEESAERMAQPWAGTALNAATVGLLRDWLLPGRRSVWRLLNQVTAPTLVIWGRNDKLVTVRKSARTARALPHARLLVLPRVGHVAQMEAPVTTARAVQGMWEYAAAGQWY
jgi:pimeloyl-ACP methyl ester carboxylesterase